MKLKLFHLEILYFHPRTSHANETWIDEDFRPLPRSSLKSVLNLGRIGLFRKGKVNLLSSSKKIM